MGLGGSQCITYPITTCILYMHISLMSPQCNLLWPYIYKSNFEVTRREMADAPFKIYIYVAMAGYNVSLSGHYACIVQQYSNQYIENRRDPNC